MSKNKAFSSVALVGVAMILNNVDPSQIERLRAAICEVAPNQEIQELNDDVEDSEKIPTAFEKGITLKCSNTAPAYSRPSTNL